MKIASIILLPLVEDPAELWRGWGRIAEENTREYLAEE